MFKIVKYILIKYTHKSKYVDIGEITQSNKDFIKNILKRKINDTNSEQIDSNIVYYQTKENLFYLIISNNLLNEYNANKIINAIDESNIGKLLIKKKSEELLHAIYNIVDSICDERLDEEYNELRVNDSSQMFYVNKYREAFLSHNSEVKIWNKSDYKNKTKIVIILSIIVIIILCAIFIPLFYN